MFYTGLRTIKENAMDRTRTIEQKRDLYLQEIARRTPPQSHHDAFLRHVYQGLLNDVEWFLMFGGSLWTEVPESVHDMKTEYVDNY